MLEHFRTFAEKKIVRLLFALFLVVPFGLFGIDYYFRAPVGGDVSATVGRRGLGPLELEQALRQQADVSRQQFRGQFDPALMDRPEVRTAVLDRLVGERLVALGVDRHGLRIGDQQLAERIASEPFFQADGRFSKERYEFVAKAQGLTPTALDERLRQDYRQQQFRGAIADTAFVPRTTLDNFIKLSEQTREVSVVQFAPDAYLAKVKTTPEQVKAYYDGHAAECTTPERVRIDYVEMSLDAVAARVSVSAEDVKKVYDKEAEAGKHGLPEQRRVSHILIAVKADAKEAERKAAEAKAADIAARVRKNPASFEAVAKQESQDPGSAVNGGDLGMSGRGAGGEAVQETAHAREQKQSVGPGPPPIPHHVLAVHPRSAA